LVNRGARWFGLSLVFSVALAGCGGEPSSVRLDLCPAQDSTADDLALLARVAAWNVVVLGLEGDDVAWRRAFGGSEPLQLEAVDIESAVPPGSQVRLIVEGFGLDLQNNERLIAVAGSDVLTLVAEKPVCLCVAPPETFAELCATRSCSFDEELGVCEGPY
jgi:hypothetical protein